MSDPTTDELLQRVLDGEASVDERARVHADPALATRLARMQEARAALAAAPPALSPDQVDALVGRALSAADGAGTNVVPLAPVAARRRNRRPMVAAVLSAAAVVLLIALAVPVLRSFGSGGEDAADQATSADTSDDSALAEDDAAGGSQLGSYSDLDDVAAALQGDDEQLAGAASGDGEETFEADDAEGGDDGGDAAAEEPADAAAPPTTTTSPAPATGGESSTDLVLPPVPPGVDPVRWCGDRLDLVDPALTSAPERGASLEWRGDAAVAFLVDLDGRAQVLVVSAADCSVLAGPSPA